MFVEPVAFEAFPEYARVDASVLASVRTRLLERSSELASTLDAAFRTMERRQPAIASYVANDLSAIDDPSAQGVGFFLAVLIVDAFEEAFGRRLGCVEFADLRAALECLLADGEVRGGGRAGRFYSEDALAIGQPAIMRLVRKEFDAALDATPDDREEVGRALDRFYETLLVLTLALTHAVAPK